MTPTRAAFTALFLVLALGTRAWAAEEPAQTEAELADIDADAVPGPRGLDLGLRIGWAIPQAEATSGALLSKTVHGAVPFWLDVGYRVVPPLVVGLYAQYAYAIVNGCDGRCHASVVRFGVQFHFHFGERGSVDHWIGLGTGYEILSEDVPGSEGALSGIEIVSLQFGEDLPLGHGFALGPFFSASLGKYLLDSRPVPGIERADDEILEENRSYHAWAMFGARLSFGR